MVIFIFFIDSIRLCNEKQICSEILSTVHLSFKAHLLKHRALSPANSSSAYIYNDIILSYTFYTKSFKPRAICLTINSLVKAALRIFPSVKHNYQNLYIFG